MELLQFGEVRRVREGKELTTTIELLQIYYKAGQVRQMSHETLVPVPLYPSQRHAAGADTGV